ncbi:hypothetical protein EIP86_001415 [Pleurotus ostreatoroseus]|nr:hypothetical protein EIP86_001415 [Pleurotus ostreatoroseus]
MGTAYTTQVTADSDPNLMKTDTASYDDVPEFTPPGPWSLSEIRAAIPPHLFVRDTRRAMGYFARDATMAAAALVLAAHTQQILASPFVVDHLGHSTAKLFQAFAWRFSHHLHHSHTALIDREEAFVPATRSDLGLPEEGKGTTLDFEDYFSDTPIWTLSVLIRHQVFGLLAYFLFNISGRKDYPRGTSHFNPYSPMFSKDQRKSIFLSDIGVLAAIICLKLACSAWGTRAVFMYYGVPWLCLSHWVVAITYLQHTDPEVPYYREGEWTFTRGAVATIDRDFLGWMGKFFLHNASHFHVVHHFFPKMPFYHGEEATTHLRQILGAHYRSSTKPVFSALWDNFNNCQFVDDTGPS